MYYSENIDFSEYNRLIDAVKYHHVKKYETIKEAAKDLLLKGYPREKISAKVTKDLEGYVNAGYVREVCADLECTDLNKANHDTVIENEDGTVSLRTQEQGDDSNDPKDNRTPEEKRIDSFIAKPNGPENLPYAKHVWKVQDFLKNMLENLGSKAFLSKILNNPEARKDLEEWMTVTDGAIDLATQEWDDRNLVSIQTHYKLAELVSASTIKFGAKQYLAWVKEEAKISSKQVTKILYGRIKHVDQIYEPLNMEDAKQSGFSGVQCPNTNAGKAGNQSCGSYRVRLEHGWARCFACDHEFEVKSLPLGQFKEDNEEDTE